MAQLGLDSAQQRRYRFGAHLDFGYSAVDGVNWANQEKATLDVFYFHLRGQRFVFDPFSDIDFSRLDRERVDRYLERYLNFFEPKVAANLAKSVSCDSAPKLKDMLRRIEDTGADEVSLVPTTSDPAELERVADALGW